MIKELMTQWRAQDAAASAGRKVLYEKVDTLSANIINADHALEAVEKEVKDLKDKVTEEVMPAVKAYTDEVQQKKGIMIAAKFFYALIVVAFTMLGFVIHELFQLWQKLPNSVIPKLH